MCIFHIKHCQIRSLFKCPFNRILIYNSHFLVRILICSGSLRFAFHVHYTESCVIRLSIFMSQFYFFDPERREKIRLTGTNAKPYHTTFHVIKCLLYDLAFSSANPKCTHFSPSSFYGKLPSWKLEELQITVHTNNPALLDACCPVNNQQAFSVRTIIAWSSL